MKLTTTQLKACLGCKLSDLDALQKLPVTKFMSTTDALKKGSPKFLNPPGFNPIHGDSFMPKNNLALLSEVDPQIPIMFGHTKDEFKLFTKFGITPPKTKEKIISDYLVDPLLGQRYCLQDTESNRSLLKKVLADH